MTDNNKQIQIDPAAQAWVQKVLDAKHIELNRMVVRREAWRIDATPSKGGDKQCYFLRIDRDGLRGNAGPHGLRREAGLIRHLSEHTSIPTQKVLAWSDEHCIAIQSFEPGRADLHNVTREEQHSVMSEFMDIMAEMHCIDVHALTLEGFEIPTTPEAHSLMELDAIDSQIDYSLPPDSTTLLGSFGKRWLRNHVPVQVERTSLLQGDTGAGNFMFADGRVTAVVDWEWAHFGDPMEDLGNVWFRDFFTPSCGGDLTGYFQHYAAKAGVQLDRSKIIYYLVHQIIRGVVFLPRLTRHADWQTTVALNLGYLAICDITCCEAIGLYHGITAPEVERLPITDNTEEGDLYRLITQQLERGIAPKLSDDFACSMLTGVADVVRHLERRHVNGSRADAMELEGINGLLGERYLQLDKARRAFNTELATMPAAEELNVLAHCWGVASRNMDLMAPLADRWRHCRLASVNV